MNRALPLLLTLPLFGGCIDVFEGLWYTPTQVDAYEWPHNEVPEEYIELVSLDGTAVGDEEDAPTLYGVWAHQCLTDLAEDCRDSDHPFFNPDNQDRIVLYFHGNGSNLQEYWDRVQILWRMGFPVFAIDYRGFGRSTGEPSEAGIYADARSALAHVLERKIEADPSLLGPEGEPPTARAARLWYYGLSLGSTAVIDLAVEHPPRAIITEAALASAQAFTDDAVGLGLSSTVLMDTQFDNIGKIPFVLSAKLLTHGLDDAFVRSEFTTLLFDAASEPKDKYMVPGAEHGTVPCPDRDNDAWSSDEPCLATDSWYTRIDGFADEFIR